MVDWPGRIFIFFMADLWDFPQRYFSLHSTNPWHVVYDSDLIPILALPKKIGMRLACHGPREASYSTGIRLVEVR